MLYEPSQVIEVSKARELANLTFGLPIADYPNHGCVVMPGAFGSYDYLAVSECRRCGHLNTTLANSDSGTLDPMSAGRGPECGDERCGDKVPVVCHAIYEIVDEPRSEDGSMVDIADLEVLGACVDALNDKLEELIAKYRGRLRIVPSTGFSFDEYAVVKIEVTNVIAQFGKDR